jgi:hypothetical protein
MPFTIPWDTVWSALLTASLTVSVAVFWVRREVEKAALETGRTVNAERASEEVKMRALADMMIDVFLN